MTCEAIITVNAANVRAQDNTSSGIVGIAQRGMVLSVSERTDAADSAGFFWFRVTLTSNNATGWLRADLIQLRGDCTAFGSLSTSIEQPEPSPQPEPTPTLTQPEPTPEEPIVLIGDCMGTVSVGTATVRSGPALSNSIRGFITRNNRFAIVEISPADDEDFRWYAFDFNGAIGWVREDLINATGDCLDLRTHGEEAATTPDPVTREEEAVDLDAQTQTCTAIIGLSQVSVRALPTVDSTRLGMATRNQRFEVMAITPTQPDGFTWTAVIFNGRDGFIRSDLVTLLGDCSRFTNDARLPRPVSGSITQGFRPSTNPTHNGIDFGTGGQQELRTPIRAVVERVTSCVNCAGDPPNIFSTDSDVIRRVFSDPDWGFGYGNHIILRFAFIDLPRDVQSFMRQQGLNEQHHAFALYAHLSELRVIQGQKIEGGTIFGVTGNTGFSSAEHLHLEVAYGTTWGSATKQHPATLFSVINA